MKIVSTISASVLLGISIAAQAQEAEKPNAEERRPMRQQILERFDLDKDGELSDEERKAAREARAQRGEGKGRPHHGRERGEGKERGHHDRKRRGQDDPRYKKHVERFDKDGDGKLSDEERRAAREAIAKGFGSRGDKMRAQMLKRYDADGDGKLSEEEKKTAHEAMRRYRNRMSEKTKAAKKQFMQQFDTDGDGALSEEEKKVAKKTVQEKMEQMKADLVAKYDADGDGKLSDEERREAHKKEREEMLKRFDADGDGELNPEERKAAFEDMLKNNPYRLMHQMMERGKHGQRGQREHKGGKPAPRK